MKKKAFNYFEIISVGTMQEQYCRVTLRNNYVKAPDFDIVLTYPDYISPNVGDNVEISMEYST